MTKCEYCEGEIDFFPGRYKWIDKESDFALHRRCSRELRKRLPDIIKKPEKWIEKIQQTDFNTLSDGEIIKIVDDLEKEVILFGRGSVKIPKEKEIQWLEHYIDRLKKRKILL